MNPESHHLERIVLIGYRGAGKSSLGKRIAKKLNWAYRSSDAEIEKIVGEPISTWVPKNGWESFRKIENQVCRALTSRKNAVLDLGGGVVENPDNLNGFLHSPGSLILWIDADLEVLITRLQKEKKRPLLHLSTNGEIDRNTAIAEEARRKYRERLPLYQRFSHHRIDNQNLSSSMKEISQILRQEYQVTHSIEKI